MSGNNVNIVSNGIPDHNACRSISPQTYRYTIPKTPTKRSGNQEDFAATNMGVIGVAINGVPIYNPYDSKCCDAGLYEFTTLDLCYAHPARKQNYHYHVASECLSPCTGESEVIGVALDGFPIMGPGINPATGAAWCQADMDVCGGREDADGNYAYYTTVDFPYYLQCYAGTTSHIQGSSSGKCGHYGANCDWSRKQPGDKKSKNKNRKPRAVYENPTAEWFRQAHALYSERGEHGSYFEQRFGEFFRSRNKRGAGPLEQAVSSHLADDSFDRPPWQGLTVDDYMRHLSYDCDACLGKRELMDNCSAERTDVCTGDTCTICEAKKPDNGCKNNCNFSWDGSTVKPPMTTTSKTTAGTTVVGTTDTTNRTKRPKTTANPDDTTTARTKRPKTGRTTTGGATTTARTTAPTTIITHETTPETTKPETTTPETTTMNPDDCPALPVNWRGAKVTKTKNQYKSIFSQQALINVAKKNGAKDPDQDLNIRKDPFIVYLIWSKKNCGPNFINAMGDGRLSIEIFDFGHWYDTSDNFFYKRDDGKTTSLTYQFFVSGGGLDLPANEDMGNKKKDQFVINYSGIDTIEWGTKDPMTCIEKTVLGVQAWSDTGTKSDNTFCVGWQKTVGF
jgi:hypothetical protein